MNRLVKIYLHMPRHLLLWVITAYQRLLSPDHSFWSKAVYPHGYCKFEPSCSQYGYEAIKKHGIIRGGFKMGWRILRCNPWNEGGIDLP